MVPIFLKGTFRKGDFYHYNKSWEI